MVSRSAVQRSGGTASGRTRGTPAGSGRLEVRLAAALLGILLGAGAMLLFNGYFVRAYLLDQSRGHPRGDGAAAAEPDGRGGRPAPRRRWRRPYHGAWAGAADGDVVLVEFFDYACGFCRASNPDVERLLREDPRLKVVWREYPVLGPDSERAAVASMAAAESGRFRQFHDRLFAAGPPSEATIAQHAARRSAWARPRSRRRTAPSCRTMRPWPARSAPAARRPS